MRVQVFADFPEALTPVIEVNSSKNIELVIDVAIKDFIIPIPENTIRIFSTIEPNGMYIDLINHNQGCFDYLITNEPALIHLPQARIMEGYPAWVRPNKDISNKVFGVSTIFSGRRVFPGHELRFELLKRRNEIKIPKFFYMGTRNPMSSLPEGIIPLGKLKNDKEEVMKCMFHICIDSYEKKYMFSEKLIDPFISMVYPIYWGCENVSDYFDTDGFIHVDSVDQIINVCNNLTENEYYLSQKFMERNYNTALKYHDYGDCLQRKIQEILNEKS
jgi:hypothetical protein